MFGMGDDATRQDYQTMVWSTERVDWLLNAMDNGDNIPRGIRKPFYDGDPNWRLGNISFEYTKKELSEIKRCARDIVYFAEKYCAVMTDDGIQRIKLRDYQKDMLMHFVNNRFNITLASRQIGKTITSAIFIAWYLVFNIDKNAMVLSNKGDTTKEIIDKTKVILENLPFFIKPGVLKNDVYSMRFDNGCRVVGQTTTKRSGISFTIHLLFLDEFAHIQENIVHEFYENVYPTLSSSKISRIIITSTPSGYNKFYDIYSSAVAGESEYAAFKVDWWQVPGRDEEWRLREIRNLGSEEAFNRQYGNQFMASSNLLLQGSTIKRLQEQKKKFIHHDFEIWEDVELDVTKELLWDPDFDTTACKDRERFWLFSIDIAQGGKGDNSVINVFEVVPMNEDDLHRLVSPGAIKDFFGLSQVARFSSNEYSIEDFSKVLYVLAYDIFYNENVKMIIEWNFNGALVMNHLQTLFPQRNEFDESMVCRFRHRLDAKFLSYGLRIRTDNKIVFCENYKKYTEQRRIQIYDEDTVKEFETFGRMPSGGYAGQMGHDDLAMSSINAGEFLMTSDFSDFVEEIGDYMDQDLYNKIEETLYSGSGADGNMEFDIYDLLE